MVCSSYISIIKAYRVHFFQLEINTHARCASAVHSSIRSWKWFLYYFYNNENSHMPRSFRSVYECVFVNYIRVQGGRNFMLLETFYHVKHTQNALSNIFKNSEIVRFIVIYYTTFVHRTTRFSSFIHIYMGKSSEHEILIAPHCTYIAWPTVFYVRYSSKYMRPRISRWYIAWYLIFQNKMLRDICTPFIFRINDSEVTFVFVMRLKVFFKNKFPILSRLRRFEFV